MRTERAKHSGTRECRITRGCDTHKWDYTSFCQTRTSGRYLRSDTSRLRNARMMAHFFLVFSLLFFPLFYFPFFHFSLSFSPACQLISIVSFAPAFLDFVSRRDSRPLGKVNERIRFRITRFCSSLRAIPHNGSDGRTFPHGLFSPLPSVSLLPGATSF